MAERADKIDKGRSPVGIRTVDFLLKGDHPNCALSAEPVHSGTFHSDRLKNPTTACPSAADEAAPIFARFYIGTSRQPWRTGLKTLESMKPA
jgi:hypothetical protein